MRNDYQFYDINTRSYEKGMLDKTNPILIKNFLKVCSWIKENCPTLNGKFDCPHNPYHWIRLVVEDGKAYLEEGSHGYGFSTALSSTETAVFSRGSMQSNPYAFNGSLFFSNIRLEEFLKNWAGIKPYLTAEYKRQSRVFSEDFCA